MTGKAQPAPLVPRVLVADDDPATRFGVRTFLESNGFRVTEAADCAGTELEFRRCGPHAVVVDHQLPDGTALDLLPRLLRLDPRVAVVVITGFGSIDLAVNALKEGAEHFLTKPVAMPALLAILERAIDNRRRRQRQDAGERSCAAPEWDPFVGDSAAITRLRDFAHQVVETDLPVVIHGETGSGKGVLARWLHRWGPRRTEAMVELNCASLPRELAEAELFGSERGAYTGAIAAKPGLLEAAHLGTVLLDEVAEMDLLVQAKLLKVVEDRQVRRLGDLVERHADVRLLLATQGNLAGLVASGRFRADLYYRVQRLDLRVPSLRERRADIPVLAGQIVRAAAAELGRPTPEISAATLHALMQHSWPGNIRELRNVLERAVLFAPHESLELDAAALATPQLPGTADPSPDGNGQTLRDAERRHIVRVLAREEHNVERAARVLGVSRSTLYQKLKDYQVDRHFG